MRACVNKSAKYTRLVCPISQQSHYGLHNDSGVCAHPSRTYDIEGLSAFLSAVLPAVESCLERNLRSHAFDGGLHCLGAF